MKWYVRYILFLFAFCGYLLRPTDVKALTTSDYIRNPSNNGVFEFNNTGYITINVTNSGGYPYQNGLFAGYGEGNVIFSFALYNDVLSVPIYQVSLHTTNGNRHNCNLGNFNTFYDNTTQVTVITAVCPVNITDGINNSILVDIYINIYIRTIFTYKSSQLT